MPATVDLLAHSDVDAEHGLTRVVELFLVDDGVNGHRRLSRLTVTDDQLTLSTADGNHRVDGLDACLQWLVHGLTVDHTWRLQLDRHVKRLSVMGPLPSKLAQHVDHAAQHAFTHLDRCNGVRALGRAAFLQVS